MLLKYEEKLELQIYDKLYWKYCFHSIADDRSAGSVHFGNQLINRRDAIFPHLIKGSADRQ